MNTSPSEYPKSYNCKFRAIQLKFKLRAGVPGRGVGLLQLHRCQVQIKTCDVFESAKHLVFQCPRYNIERAKIYDCIIDDSDEDTFNLLLSDWNYGFGALRGDCDNYFNKIFLTFLENVWTIH